MYALMISAFVRRELQLSFYANETTGPVHGVPCREGERSIEFYPQCFKKPRDVTITVESEHDKTNTMTCTPANYIISLGIRKACPSSLSIDP